MKIRTLLIGLAALSIAGCSAYFSIIGLSTLFAGASTVIMIMAASMEFSKLVTASFLYMYWDKLGRLMKTYLTSAILVLVIITSMGIYGFLTAAFQSTSQELAIIERQVENVESRKDRYEEKINHDRQDRDTMNETVTSLTEGLATGNVVQYVDAETGQLVTSTSSAQRNILRDQLERAQNERDRLSQRIEAYTDSVTTLDQRILDLQSNTELATELGPLQFVAEVLNVPMVQVVNAIAILIMFSFDPLAIMLVIAFNMSVYFNNREKFDRVLKKKPKEEPPTDDEDEVEEVIEDIDEDDTPIEQWKDEVVETAVKSVEETEDIYGEDEPIQTEQFVKEEVIEELKEVLDEDEDDIEIDDTTLDDIKERSQEVVNRESETVEKPKKLSNRERLSNLSKKATPVRYTKGGKIIGHDQSADGEIDKWEHSTYYRSFKDQKPYYAQKDFNWDNLDSWIDDQAAVNYWITNVKNSSKYPTDFSSKTY